MMTRRLARLMPLVAVAAAGCFATTNDVRLLQAHIEQLQRSEETAHSDADKARLAELQRDSSVAMAISRLAAMNGSTRDTLHTLADSVRHFMDQFSRFRASAALADSQSNQLSYQILEMMGLNQKKIADLQNGFDAQKERAGVAAPGDTSGRGNANLARQMYQTGMTQMQQSRFEAAQGVFQDFITQFPNDPLMPSVLLQLAETHARQGNDAIADSVYKSIVVRFPKSPEAPNALWKRAEALRKAGQPKAAEALYRQIVADYPKSDVVRQAKDRLPKPPPL